MAKGASGLLNVGEIRGERGGPYEKIGRTTGEGKKGTSVLHESELRKKFGPQGQRRKPRVWSSCNGIKGGGERFLPHRRKKKKKRTKLVTQSSLEGGGEQQQRGRLPVGSSRRERGKEICMFWGSWEGSPFKQLTERGGYRNQNNFGDFLPRGEGKGTRKGYYVHRGKGKKEREPRNGRGGKGEKGSLTEKLRLSQEGEGVTGLPSKTKRRSSRSRSQRVMILYRSIGFRRKKKRKG